MEKQARAGISDREFREAMTMAYRLFTDALDSLVKTRVKERRGSRGYCRRRAGPKEKAADRLVDRRQGDIVWLIGGLLGEYLAPDNAEALKKARELALAGVKRAAEARKGDRR